MVYNQPVVMIILKKNKRQEEKTSGKMKEELTKLLGN